METLFIIFASIAAVCGVLYALIQLFVASKKNLKKSATTLYIVAVTVIALGVIFYCLDIGGCRISYRGDTWSILDNMTDPFSLEAGLFFDLGLIVLILAVIVTSRIRGITKQENLEKAAQEEKTRQHEEFLQSLERNTWEFPVDTFIKRCESNKVFQIHSSADYQRAKLITQELLRELRVPEKYHSRYTNEKAIKHHIEILSKRREAEKAKKERAQMQQMQSEEAELCEKYTYYAEYTEQSKSIQICRDKISAAKEIIRQCEQDEISVKNGGEATYLMGRQKESSWAVHGGIASGIAGGAAGLAVAADTERRNQVKRQQNAALASNIASLSVMQLEKIWDRKRGAEYDVSQWTKKLNEAKMLLCDNLDEQKLLNMMHPSVEKTEITKTGAVKLKVNLHSTPNLIIFDEVKAVVDGSIQVILKVDDEVVGTAVCVLPYGGMSYRATVDGICCEPSKKIKKYTYEFKPYHLWAVETKEEIFDTWGDEQKKKAEALAQEKRRADHLHKIKETMAGKIAVADDTRDTVEVLTVMKGKGPLTARAIHAKLSDPEKVTIQRVNGILRNLEDGKIVKQSEHDGWVHWEYK